MLGGGGGGKPAPGAGSPPFAGYGGLALVQVGVTTAPGLGDLSGLSPVVIGWGGPIGDGAISVIPPGLPNPGPTPYYPGIGGGLGVGSPVGFVGGVQDTGVLIIFDPGWFPQKPPPSAGEYRRLYDVYVNGPPGRRYGGDDDRLLK